MKLFDIMTGSQCVIYSIGCITVSLALMILAFITGVVIYNFLKDFFGNKKG